jgi:segregation and condensation protein B
MATDNDTTTNGDTGAPEAETTTEVSDDAIPHVEAGEQQPLEQEAAGRDQLLAAVEALLFVSKQPLTTGAVRRALSDDVKLSDVDVARLVEELRISYLRDGRGFRLVELAGGYQLRTASDFAPYILKLFKEPREERLSQPALETLAIIAYRQPIVKAEIEAIRGVDVSGVLQTLVDRGLVRIAGRKEVPGRPFLYETTRLFLEHFGLKAVDDLPHISELRAADPKQGTLDLK